MNAFRPLKINYIPKKLFDRKTEQVQKSMKMEKQLILPKKIQESVKSSENQSNFNKKMFVSEARR